MYSEAVRRTDKIVSNLVARHRATKRDTKITVCANRAYKKARPTHVAFYVVRGSNHWLYPLQDQKNRGQNLIWYGLFTQTTKYCLTMLRNAARHTYRIGSNLVAQHRVTRRNTKIMFVYTRLTKQQNWQMWHFILCVAAVIDCIYYRIRRSLGNIFIW
jgi:hypothetical protein